MSPQQVSGRAVHYHALGELEGFPATRHRLATRMMARQPLLLDLSELGRLSHQGARMIIPVNSGFGGNA